LQRPQLPGVYLAVVAVLAAGYAAVVALLVSGLGLSGTVAAATAAAGAALALAPLRTAMQGAVNRLMYGDPRRLGRGAGAARRTDAVRHPAG
jgi:hypothetical protein